MKNIKAVKAIKVVFGNPIAFRFLFLCFPLFLSILLTLYLHKNTKSVEALDTCPWVLPYTVTGSEILTPDNLDGKIDCSAGNVTVSSTGILTIERYITADTNYTNDWGVTLLVANLTVESGGVITADGKGYQPGETDTDGIALSATGTSGGGGGGYGGAGGEGMLSAGGTSDTGSTFGNQENPIRLGGAGGNSGEGGAGGNGGGALKVEASGTVTIDGEITANGTDGILTTNSSGGGGAGGAIWLEVGVLAGAGTVSANGGSAPYRTAGINQGGGGGGGRIIAFCDTANNFTGTVTVTQGITDGDENNSQDGGVGTILGPTCRPDEPTIVKQFMMNGTTEIPVGGATTENSSGLGRAIFVANMNDNDLGDLLGIQVEIRELGVDFINVPNFNEDPIESNPQVCISGTISDCGNVTVSVERSKEYHWQVRVRDDAGGFSNWVSFGGNLETERDILFVGSPTTMTIFSGDGQTTTVGTALPVNMVVNVTDTAGYDYPGLTVNWLITAGGGSMNSATSVTDASGNASNNMTTGTTKGTQTVAVSASGTNSVNFNHTKIADDPNHFDITVPRLPVYNTNFQVDITVRDQYNNIVDWFADTITFTDVDPTDEITPLAGTLTPADYTFTGAENGQVINNNISI
jgi:hypothetical protein